MRCSLITVDYCRLIVGVVIRVMIHCIGINGIICNCHNLEFGWFAVIIDTIKIMALGERIGSENTEIKVRKLLYFK